MLPGGIHNIECTRPCQLIPMMFNSLSSASLQQTESLSNLVNHYIRTSGFPFRLSPPVPSRCDTSTTVLIILCVCSSLSTCMSHEFLQVKPSQARDIASQHGHYQFNAAFTPSLASYHRVCGLFFVLILSTSCCSSHTVRELRANKPMASLETVILACYPLYIWMFL
jgi:hypothetical protein